MIKGTVPFGNRPPFGHPPRLTRREALLLGQVGFQLGVGGIQIGLHTGGVQRAQEGGKLGLGIHRAAVQRQGVLAATLPRAAISFSTEELSNTKPREGMPLAPA